MTIGQIKKSLQETIDYFINPNTAMQAGRTFQAEVTLKQLNELTKSAKSIQSLNESYKEAVMAYISVFEEKQCVIFGGWLGDNFGEYAYFNDVIISFDNVRYDINVSAPKDAYINWYNNFTNNSKVSYPNWLKMVHGIKRYYYFDDK